MSETAQKQAGYEQAKAEIIEVDPAHQFLFDRDGGLLEYLWDRAYEQGRQDLFTAQQAEHDAAMRRMSKQALDSVRLAAERSSDG